MKAAILLLAVMAGPAWAQGAPTGDAVYDAAYQRYVRDLRAAEGAMHDVETLKPGAETGPKSDACAKAGRAASLYGDALSEGQSLPASNSVSHSEDMAIAAELAKVAAAARHVREIKLNLCKAA